MLLQKSLEQLLLKYTINDYAVIEQIFDQLGAEKYLQSLFIKKCKNNL